MKNMLLFSCMLFLFCGHLFSQEHVNYKSCTGVLINGVCWAECNVDSPGTFVATPEAYGMYYQWNRKKGWPNTVHNVIGWDSSIPSGDSWETANNPCPVGWRVPTSEEMATLQDNSMVAYGWTFQNGIRGGKFTDKATGNVIFFPAFDLRDGRDGTLVGSSGGHYWSSLPGLSLIFMGGTVAQFTAFPGNFGLLVRCVADWDLPDCDSIVKDTSATICAGDLPYTWGDTVFQVGTMTGKYRFQRTSTVTGCDSIVYLTLTVNPVYETTIYDTICHGDAYYKHGFSLPNVTASGDHRLSLVSQAGCDSILSLHLTVFPAVQQILYDSVCPSSSYVKYGFDLSDVITSGSFQLPLQTVHGCDSMVILNLYVYPTWLYPRSEDICEGDTIDFRGRRLYESGIYYDTLTTMKGCDSIYCMNLTVHPVPHLSFSDVVCYGREYTKNGFHLPVVWADTLVSDTLQSMWGCDSIRSLYLTVNPLYNMLLYDTICQGDSYYKHGFSLPNVTAGGDHRLSLVSQAGCDSILSLHLTVFPAVQQILYDSVCPSSSYVKHGFDLSDVITSGSFQLPLQTVHGCDSLVTLELYVYPTWFYPRSESICEGNTIDFRGRRLYESGVYFDSLTTVKGCDSIYCMNLTVHPVPHLSFSDVVCYGSEYTKNGFHLPVVWADTLVSDTLQSMWGCDSIRSLYLTVNPLYNTLLYDTICHGDAYYKHGFSLPNVTASGDHRLSLVSQAGCDSILSLHLTVFPAVQQILYDSVCPSSHYVKHGFDLSDVITGGSFQLPLQTVHGCDSLVVLNLYVYPTYFYPHSESFCEGDTIDFRGKRLYESGIYYDTLTTIKGCDSIIMLDLREEKKIQGSIALLLEDCVTHTYTFSFESEIPVGSWQWDMGDGTVLHSEKGFHNYPDSGVYRIQLRTETYNGCENTFSYVKHVPQYMPEVQFQADRQIIDQGSPTVHFRVEVLPEMTCMWDFGDGTTGEGVSVSHTYNLNSEKYYDVVLSVVNTEGCITKSRAQIEVDLLLKPVNTFSPNGDGINDVFMAGYRVEIVNRNGLRVYVGDNGWDGTYNGRQAQQDTYFYRLYYQTASGEKMKTGYVTLIR